MDISASYKDSRGLRSQTVDFALKALAKEKAMIADT